MLPKGILFDLDDTIIAYTPVAEPTWQRVCEEFAGSSSVLDTELLYKTIRTISSWYWSNTKRHKEGRKNLDRTRRAILELVFQELKVSDTALAWKIADAFSEQREEEIYLFPQALETLEYLAANNVSLAMMTNGEKIKQRSKIDKFGLEKYFKAFFIEGELGFGKPDKEVYLGALEALGLKPEEVWAVGDNLEWDVKGPQKLGIFGIWNDVEGKGLSPSSKVTPDRIINSIAELIE